MFGPIASRGPNSRRHSRRQFAAVALGAIVLGALISEVALQVVRSGSSTTQRNELSWVAAAVPIVDSSNEVPTIISTVRDAPSGLCKNTTGCSYEVEQALNLAYREALGHVDSLASLGLTPVSPRALALLSTVFSTRLDATETFRSGTELALTGLNSESGNATALITKAGSEMKSSDQYYADFLESLSSRVRRRFPTSVWVRNPSQWNTAAVASFVTAISSSALSGPGSGLKILAITLLPPPEIVTGLPSTTVPTNTVPTTTSTTTTLPATSVASPTTTPRKKTATTTTIIPVSGEEIPPVGVVSVLAPTRSLSVALVVKNTGVLRVQKVTVSETIGESSGSSAQNASVAISDLGPGSSHYVALPPLRIRSGMHRFVLVVTVSAPRSRTATDRFTIVVSK